MRSTRDDAYDPSPEFRMTMVASQEDVDELGHISNIAYVRWIQDVAVAHSDSVGYSQADYEALGAIFVVRKHTVEYLRSAFAGDEIILSTHIAWWRAAVTERRTQVLRGTDGVVLVEASTLWAFVSITTGKPTRISPELEAAFYPDRAGSD